MPEVVNLDDWRTRSASIVAQRYICVCASGVLAAFPFVIERLGLNASHESRLLNSLMTDI